VAKIIKILIALSIIFFFTLGVDFIALIAGLLFNKHDLCKFPVSQVIVKWAFSSEKDGVFGIFANKTICPNCNQYEILGKKEGHQALERQGCASGTQCNDCGHKACWGCARPDQKEKPWQKPMCPNCGSIDMVAWYSF